MADTESITALDQLRKYPCWVCYRLEQRDGKDTKIPYNAKTAREASSTDPHTWCGYDFANSQNGEFSGIGFVFDDSNPFTGIDLDKCIIDGKVETSAINIVNRINSYTEYSPSGRGLHILVQGKLPPELKGNRKGRIEIYSRARYFTWTGKHFDGTPQTIENRQSELIEFHKSIFGDQSEKSKPQIPSIQPPNLDNADILEKARTSINSKKFIALFDNGDLTDYANDESSGDLALCSILAFWCGDDSNKIDRLFRQSKLCREKWLNREDYRQRTIKSALKNCKRFYGCEYSVTSNSLMYNKPTKDGVVKVPLTNFNAKIIADLTYDDGAERQQSFEIEAEFDNQKKTCRIPASKFSAMNWPIEQFGASATIYAGQGIRDHARTAIQVLSTDAQRRTIYTHTGWRKIDDQWLYLVGNGAIGKDGFVSDVDVILPDGLHNYKLTEPNDAAELIESIQASMMFLQSAEPYITYPLYCAVWRAVLGNTDYSMHITGDTGAGKTTLVSLALNHFGGGFSETSLPTAWSSTANSLEIMAFILKDCLLVIDDFKPSGSRTQQQALYATAERLLRAQGNKSGRQRLRADATLKAVKPPRGLIISTGEELPHGQSLRARCQIIEIGRNDVWRHKEILTACQRQAHSGLYEKAMFGYIRYIAANYETIRNDLAGQIHELRATAATCDAHERTPGIIASQFIGLKYFAEYAKSIAAITEQAANDLLDQCWQVLTDLGSKQTDVQRSEDPALRFIELISSAVSSGRAHIAGKDGGEPLTPEAFGWRKYRIGLNDEWRPQGDRIGWINDDTGEMFLDPDASFRIALNGDSQNTLAITPRTLKKRLVEKELVLPDTARGMTTFRRDVQGRRSIEVLWLKPGLLTGECLEVDDGNCPI